MPSVPNQFLITIKKTPVTGSTYLQIKKDEWIAASRVLTPSGFQLFLYLANIQNGYKDWELSKVAVSKEFGFSGKTYDRAKANLIEHGYLVPVDSVHYDFFTSPKDKNVPT